MQVVFTWHPGATEEVRRELSTGALVRSYGSEADMLTAWQQHFDEADPDAIPLFQVCFWLDALPASNNGDESLHWHTRCWGSVVSSKASLMLLWLGCLSASRHRRQPILDPSGAMQVRDTLGALSERWKALGLSGTQSCRLSRHAGQRRRPVSVRRITMYSADWVKRQTRMASTSNQETFRAEVDGRLVFDILRQVGRHAVQSC